MKINKTIRGFSVIEFEDRYEKSCSLQKSSIAFEDCIWLGVDDQRMHLTKGMVKDLLPHLKKFVETGEI